MPSEITICNLALSRLGAEPISSFLEDNKNSRLSGYVYGPARQWLLSTIYWTFARKVVDLNVLAAVHPYYLYQYQLPVDCLKPFYIDRRRVYRKWEVEGSRLVTDITPVTLHYVYDVVNSGLFTQGFANALSWVVQADLAYPIVQDKVLAREARAEARVQVIQAQELDAGIGNTYRDEQMDPNFDTFVTPSASVFSGEEA